MSTIILSEQHINDIILRILNEKEEKYWVKSIIRNLPNSIVGTEVSIAPLQDNCGEGISKIVFDKISLTVEGNLAPFQPLLQEAYINKMCELSSEFKEFYESSLAKIEEKVDNFKNFLFARFLNDGYVKNDIHLIWTGSGVKSLPETIYQRRHGEFLPPIENKFDKPNRKIVAGEIYYADLNPAFSSEFAGVRPVLVLKTCLPIVKVVPITSTDSYHDKRLQFNLSSSKYKLEKDSFICLNYSNKPIDKCRLLQFIDKLDETDFRAIQKMIIEDEFDNSILNEYQQDLTEKMLAALDDDILEDVDLGTEFKSETQYQPTLIESQVAEEKNEVTTKNGLMTAAVHLPKIVNNPNMPSNTSVTEPLHIERSDNNFSPMSNNFEFDLTDEEILDICNQKIKYMQDNGSKRQFYNPEVFRTENGTMAGGTLMAGITVTYNQKHSDPVNCIFETEIIFKPLQVSFQCGDNFYPHDDQLEELTVKTLSKKYPKQYPFYFIMRTAGYLHNGYVNNGDVETKVYKLNKKTHWLGVEFSNPKTIIENGVSKDDYYKMLDVERTE